MDTDINEQHTQTIRHRLNQPRSNDEGKSEHHEIIDENSREQYEPNSKDSINQYQINSEDSITQQEMPYIESRNQYEVISEDNREQTEQQESSNGESNGQNSMPSQINQNSTHDETQWIGFLPTLQRVIYLFVKIVFKIMKWVFRLLIFFIKMTLLNLKIFLIITIVNQFLSIQAGGNFTSTFEFEWGPVDINLSNWSPHNMLILQIVLLIIVIMLDGYL